MSKEAVRLVVLREQLRFALMLLLILAASLVGGALATAATLAPTFARTDYPFMGHQVVGDFNGDTMPDLAGQGAQAVAVRLNSSNGTFGAVVEYPLPASPQHLAAGDFNGDGKLDLVATHNDPHISLSLLTGRGDGTFNAPASFLNTSGFDSPEIVVADLNNDGKLDIVIAHNAACFVAPCVIAEIISVMLGNGNGTFQPTRAINVGRGTGSLAVGDFNRDGFKDLAIAGMNAQLYRLIGVGDGTFIQQPTLTLVADNGFVNGSDIDVADFNRDGIEDLVVAIASNGSRTAILIGNGDGTFRPPLILTDPNINIPQYQAVADYNGDGFLDLALSMGDGNQGLMNMRNGNGDGTFQAPVVFLTPPPGSSAGGAHIVSADLNGDGKPDIVLGQAGAFPGLLVLINSTGVTPPPTPAAPTLVSPAADATPAQPVNFDWTDVANATSYEIQVDDSSTIAAPFRANQIVSVSQVSIGGLPAQRLWWRVRAQNSAGVFGAFSSTRRFTPQATASVPALSAIALSPTNVVGGNSAQGTATLTSAAPPGGALVTLSSSNLSVATVPASTIVAAGATSASFSVNTVSVAIPALATITAAFGGATRSATLTATPPPPPQPPVGPESLFVSPATVQGGNSAVGTIFLSGGPPVGGLVVTLTSSNPAAATVPATTIVFLSSGTFPISTLAAPTTRTTTITASANGVSRTAILNVIGSAAPPPPTPSALSLSPATVQGGNSSTGTVTLSSAALSGGATVVLTSSNPAAASVPASVTVAAGASSASFSVTTGPVGANTSVTLSAFYNGTSRAGTLTVTAASAPPPPPASLNTLVLNPGNVTGGGTSQGSVTLTSAAPTGGALVTLSDNSTAAAVPASITVPAGATAANFTVTTTTVTAATAATISAVLAGTTRVATLTVNPPGANATLTVSASGRSGERVTSNPAGINVSVGSSGSASFATGTAITLSATNGRDVVWSGACSSGGNKTKTCAFTINGNASVTGNVQ